MSKSERAELEEALAYYGKEWPEKDSRPQFNLLRRIARKYLATLPPDPVKARNVYAILCAEGMRYGIRDDASEAESMLAAARAGYPERGWRIVRYVPQEE